MKNDRCIICNSMLTAEEDSIAGICILCLDEGDICENCGENTRYEDLVKFKCKKCGGK